MTLPLRDTIQFRLSRERGTIRRDAPLRVALLYPSPYAVGMSSLGFQVLYRALNARRDTVAERVFAPDRPTRTTHASEPPRTYESFRPLADHAIVAVSIAYENELGGLLSTLDSCGIPALRSEREPVHHPFVLAGGPLTFSNPLPLMSFADAVVLGEAEELIDAVFDALTAHRSHEDRLRALAALPHVWVPLLHGDGLPSMAVAEVNRLPACSVITTPEAELGQLFLVEAVRGCARRCTYCVMRGSSRIPMRIVPVERVLASVPGDARRVGLVGAAVSDPPGITELVETLAARGLGVGLSSLRPDRLNERLVAALARAGYQTLTTALDGASERLRSRLDRHTREEHLEHAAMLARAHGMRTLKLYLMVGVPTETDEDIDECAALVRRLSATIPVALGVAAFVAKRNTPLAGLPFAGIEVVEGRLDHLRRALAGRADVRPTSARWAWVEWVLAQGGEEAGRAVLQAVRAGGRFRDYQRAFEQAGVVPGRTG